MRESTAATRWAVPAVVAVVVFVLGPRAGDTIVPGLLHRATSAAHNGLPTTALADLEAALQLDPALAPLHLSAADLALRAGDSERAVEHLESAPGASTGVSSCEPVEGERRLEDDAACGRQAALLSLLAYHLWSENAFEQAYTELNRLAELQAASADELRLRALAASVYDIADAGDAAREALASMTLPDPLLQDLAALDPPSDDVSRAAYLARVGGILALGAEWPLAERALEMAVAEQPNLATARAYLGMALERRGESGYRHIWGAVLSDPSSSPAWTMMGTFWLEHGETQRALEALRHARRLDPRNAAAASAYGAALAARGDIDEAADAYLQAAELMPDRPDFWVLLARLCLENEHAVSSLGLPAARNAVTLAPGRSPSLDVLGQALVLSGEPRLAVRLLRRAIGAAPFDASSYYHLGLGYLGLSDGQMASQALEVAIRLDPAGPIGSLSARILQNIAR
ncbi:MAG TPA: tetratricopeptide repeat protein [Anaerolineales bacterium]|nr:tetratricopeptide repeat protein [Anaerolineales bacterium]